MTQDYFAEKLHPKKMLVVIGYKAEEIKKHAESYKRDQLVKMERPGFWAWLRVPGMGVLLDRTWFGLGRGRGAASSPEHRKFKLRFGEGVQ